MKKTYFKLMLRSVKKTYSRFLSILGIVAIGVGFLSGLLATTPDMLLTADRYYDANNLYDLDIKGTLGLTEADVQAVEGAEGVDTVMPAFVTDLNMEGTDGGTYVSRLYGVPLDEMGSDAFLNGVELVSGRMPENNTECVVILPMGYSGDAAIGETYTISKDNKDYEKRGDTYNVEVFTVVGVVRSPQYMSLEGEPSKVGSGQISRVLYTFGDAYSLEAYTDIFLTCKGAKAADTFGDEYKRILDSVAGTIKDLGIGQSEIRYTEVVSKAQAELDDGWNKYNEAKAEAETKLADARKKLDDGYASLDAAKKELDSREASLTAGEADLEAAKMNLETSIAAQRAELEAARPVIGEDQYAAGMAQLDQSQSDALAQIAVQETALADGRTAIADARAQIAANEADLISGEKEYTDAKAESEAKLASALADLEQGQKDIEAIEHPKWYVIDRTDTLSHAGFKANVDKIGAVGKVFPVFFFLVAALVALTTMTRMVDEERVQNGTLKALGYSNGSIMLYYLGYSILASLIGGVIGVTIGFSLLPKVISNAYAMMYDLSETVTVFWWNYALTVVPIAILCTVAATLAAGIEQTSHKPSVLMLPKVPKPGKRILLERIRPLWRHMSFTKKVTARNIFRYKKRLYMTVIGIAGCAALLVTGFGLRDSIGAIVEKQFGDIYRYNMSLYLEGGGAYETDEIIKSFLQDKNTVENYALVHSETGEASTSSGTQDITLYVPKDTVELKKQINIRERKTGADIPFEDDSVILTEKLCEKLNLSIGDIFTLTNADGESRDFKVSGVAENYVTNFVFISTSNYEETFGVKADYNVILAGIKDESQQSRDKISERILGSDNVLLVQFSQSIKESFENSIKSIDYIVIVLIVAAAALAVIVVYNLTNINICERKKELATIKVLGFRDKEVAAYIYRETSILCLIGIAAGFFVGKLLHIFVIRTAEVEGVMFGRSVHFTSYLFAALITIGFTILVDIFMLRSLKSIDMVESMKANE
ncbi:FtsX-like permease family protein [Parasporobacterium paucivorans]|uniref:Putative ABC transport system permease protein n=1 Tax=Parasporobacterium paucivorans DSM 15970 TaxID=1122934 RepID=A0A1M6HNW0_9FIRM|nr:FtsX-like permease family protein [Parasporobacterium paucivorans]SHJ23931.1 putative ABC transport system permease protein [Parasporobacterium paucivorans DSM 15970]